ncbi:hypothetical protein TH25_25545 [Thalassospira profundimaris]|uniref:Dystroglycan-type cadherin-like domain-containing protein n=1 Tax=Thalassospira profundimaris TaxID=502049 RepID=A0A367WDF0_9PROT|nr:hypothetical protein TH25_25545 [Thalassospira profundimaris]
MPGNDNGETATLSFKAWDTTTGTASTNTVASTADTSTTGGTSAFSTGTASASLVVSDVNDAPTVTNGASVTLTGTNEDTTSSATLVSSMLTSAGYNDVDSGASSGIAITGLTGNGTWQYSTDGNNWVNLTSASGTAAVLLSSSSQVRYVPDGNNGETASLSFKAWDQTSGTASGNSGPGTADTTTSGGTSAFSTGNVTASLAVSDVNDAPDAPASLAGTTVENGGPLNYSVSVAGFNDVDGDNLSFKATLADGSALPAWLSYQVNGTTVTFTGTVPGSFIGNLPIRITATEDASAHLTASSDLTIRVEARLVVVTTPPPSAPEPVAQPQILLSVPSFDLGDTGAPVTAALDQVGGSSGEIPQAVTGRLGSQSAIDNSGTPVSTGLRQSRGAGFGTTGGTDAGRGGFVGAGLGGGFGGGGFGGGLGTTGSPFGTTGAGALGAGGDAGNAPLPSGDGGPSANETLNGNQGQGGAVSAPQPQAAPTPAPEATPAPAPKNSGETGTTPPEDGQGNVQGVLTPQEDASVDIAFTGSGNIDFADQLAGAGGAVDRQASLLAKALSAFDVFAA